MNTKTITTISIIVASVLLVGWNLYANFNAIRGDTISETIGNWIRSAPVIMLVIGVVVGHFASDWPGIQPIVAGIAARPLIPLVYGAVGGFFFWNMNR
jgi:hypothetical protein